MNLTSLAFFGFFAAVFGLYWLAPARWRWAPLLADNLWFYLTMGSPALLWTLAAATLASWGAALALGRWRTAWAKRCALLAALAVCLGLLLWFKYAGFFAASANWLAARLGLGAQLPAITLALPAGISFYTLQTISYLMDVYRGRLAPEKHLGRYAAYQSFFVLLTSGPIERPGSLLPQLQNPGRFDADEAIEGFWLVLLGLFQKIPLGNILGNWADKGFNDPLGVTGMSLLFSALCYSFHIYYDFAGYSNMALGLGKLLGLQLTQNFRQPYFATSIRDFWGRWHISFSSWLRDYVYFPLGGSRKGRARTYLNLMLTFLVSGLWHGAGSCFLFWGALHGAYQVAGRATAPLREKAWRALHIRPANPLLILWKMGFTFCIVSFAWVFFRVGTAGGGMADAWAFLAKIGAEFSLSLTAIKNGLAMMGFTPFLIARLAVFMLLGLLVDCKARSRGPGAWLMSLSLPPRFLLGYVFVFASMFCGADGPSSIYHQF